MLLLLQVKYSRTTPFYSSTGLAATYTVHLTLTGIRKLAVDFLFVLIEHFYPAAWNADAVLR